MIIINQLMESINFEFRKSIQREIVLKASQPRSKKTIVPQYSEAVCVSFNQKESSPFNLEPI